MADTQSYARFLNPWVLHFQKLGLELKCSFCLSLYNKPMLLPCNHIFCSSCLPTSKLFGLDCHLCKKPYVEQDLREAPYMENVVNIYRSLDATFSTHMLNSDFGTVTDQCQSLAKRNLSDQLAKGPIDPSPQGNLTSKRVQLSNNSSVMANLEGNCLGASNGSIERNFQTWENNPSSINQFSQTRATQNEQHEAVYLDMNLVESYPDSPPSSGGSKGVEIGSPKPAIGDEPVEKKPLMKCGKRTIDEFGAQGNVECHDSNQKKQKQLNQGVTNMDNGHFSPSAVVNPTNSLVGEFDSTSFVNFTCAFCQTWKITEGSGPMQHFADGKQVAGSEAVRSNVIHVHKSCIEWAPQIFYENGTVVKNLGKELARAGKLKCTSCGLKGAALGCYAKSCRRSYHVPCAYEIAQCRWDSGEFLMLCPSHTSLKFPSEKSKKSSAKKCTTSSQRHDEQRSSGESDFWATSPTGAKNWVLCGSALSADEKLMLVKFTNLCGATVTKNWNPSVTHVIAATSTNGACARTFKVLMAILEGKWILTTDWIKACIQSKCPVDEQPYEVRLDNHGCCDGPTAGRLRAVNNGPKLFSGLKFFFAGDFVPTYKNDLQDLIIAAEGTIVENKEQLQQSTDATLNPSMVIVVYNGDSMMSQIEAKTLAAESESNMIAHTWILDSIASSKLQQFGQR